MNSMETSTACCAFLALLLLPHAGWYFLLSLFSFYSLKTLEAGGG